MQPRHRQLWISGLGTTYPAVHNDSDKTVCITFTLAGSEEKRSVYIPPKSVGPFHTRDGVLRADTIEFKEEHGEV